MAHGDAVGHGDGRELARRSLARLHTELDCLRLARQRDIARRRLVPAGSDPDEGLGDLLLRHAHRIVVGPMRRALRADRNIAAGPLRFVEGHATASSLPESSFPATTFRANPD